MHLAYEFYIASSTYARWVYEFVLVGMYVGEALNKYFTKLFSSIVVAMPLGYFKIRKCVLSPPLCLHSYLLHYRIIPSQFKTSPAISLPMARTRVLSLYRTCLRQVRHHDSS
jgi:hypothetical protein